MPGILLATKKLTQFLFFNSHLLNSTFSIMEDICIFAALEQNFFINVLYSFVICR